jgi:hypothetical protein
LPIEKRLKLQKEINTAKKGLSIRKMLPHAIPEAVDIKKFKSRDFNPMSIRLLGG